MKPRDRGETDAIVRRLRGYARVFLDPVQSRQADSPDVQRVRMMDLICDGFLDLDKRLQSGEPLPEPWDGTHYHRPRERNTERHGNSAVKFDYTYPPGMSGPAGCTVAKRRCDWIDAEAAESACRRCHTIRMRVADAIEA